MLTKNLELQHEDLAAIDDGALADHIARAVAHFAEVSLIHFEHTGFDIAVGTSVPGDVGMGHRPADVAPLLAGASPATAAVAAHVDEIVQQLDAVPDSLDDVRAAGDEAARALDSFFQEHEWRVIDGNDLAGPTLGERPALVLATIRARMRGGPPAVDDGRELGARSRAPRRAGAVRRAARRRAGVVRAS